MDYDTSAMLLIREFEYLKVDLIKEHRALGMEASGRWINSLEVIGERLSVKLLGSKYTEQLEYGRGATKSSSSTGKPLIESIRQWVRDKGLASQQKEVNTIAFLVTRKIHREGWKREKHGGVGLVSKVITPQRIQSIIDKVGQKIVIDVVADIQFLMKELA